MRTSEKIFEFTLPQHLACPLPTEERGIRRDEVRLLVTSNDGERIEHTDFGSLYRFLNEGDLLVVNTTAVEAAAIPVTLPGVVPGVVHFSTRLKEGEYLVEIRSIEGNDTRRWHLGKSGQMFHFENGDLTLVRPYYQNSEYLHLWIAHVDWHESGQESLSSLARPIKYANVDTQYPLDYYQTYFSFHTGSSEMPSAGRGFTKELVNDLILRGVGFAPILLHTGVSSLEENELPYPEYMEVDPVSASLINSAKRRGSKVVAVGTTAIRALESLPVNDEGILPFKGYTDLFIHGDYSMRVADGLLTGFHEPRASHLHMLQSMVSYVHLEKAYDAALKENYYWHEFGDLHLILP